MKILRVLGIESSCDETSAAILDSNKNILANIVYSQIERHKPYCGVVPEIAARAHSEKLDTIIIQALEEAKLSLSDIDAIAVTSGPGLVGGLIVGVMMAKAIAEVLSKPIIAVNHLEGHAIAPRIVSDIEYPYLALLISGGHCQFVIVEDLGRYKIIGATKDDAVGEAFDKLAKMLGLGYPGGPIVEKYAREGDQFAYNLPVALKGREGCDFSFSGIKTAMKRIVDQESENGLSEQFKKDLCASFQYTVKEILCDRMRNAFDIYNASYSNAKFVVSGGVAANQYLRSEISSFCAKHNYEVVYPPMNLCTDNAAMIAWVGIEKLKRGLVDDLSFEPRPKWPLS